MRVKHSRRAAISLVLLTCSLVCKPASAVSEQAADLSENEAAGALPVACSPDKPAAWPGETITLRAFVTPTSATPSNRQLQYVWSATGGQVEGKDSNARWDFAGTASGSYTATVRVESLGSAPATCSLQVIVKEPSRGEPERESGRGLLVRDQVEAQGYGLYSYLLFGSRPNDTSRERYAEAVQAYWDLLPAINDLESQVVRRELNVTYLPVDTAPVPWKPATAQWLLEHYDYARARLILRTISGDQRDGPYIVSSLKPISVNAALEGPHLYMDLSGVPPQVVSLWVKEFLNQAAQERFWEERTGARLALRMRTVVGAAALGLGPVLQNLKAVIVWLPNPQ